MEPAPIRALEDGVHILPASRCCTHLTAIVATAVVFYVCRRLVCVALIQYCHVLVPGNTVDTDTSKLFSSEIKAGPLMRNRELE